MIMSCKCFVFVVLLFCSISISFATNRVSAGVGPANWTAAASWSPAGVPAAGDNITILSGHTITMSGNSGSCTDLTINGIATWSAVRTTNVSGNLIINNGGCITGTVTGVLNVTGTFNVPSGASVAIGRCSITVTAGTTVDGILDFNSATGVKTFGNATISSTGTWTSSSNSAFIITGSLTNSGTFTSPGTGTYTFSGAAKSFSGTAAITIGTASVTGTYTNSNTASLSVTGVLSGAGGLTQGANSTLKLGATPSITTLTATANPNLVIYNGAAAQTMKATTYHNLEVATASGTVTATFGGNTTVNNNFTITSGTAAIGAVTSLISGITSITGTLSVSSTTGSKTYNNIVINSGGTWTSSVSETNTINGNLTMSGGSITGTGTGIYNVAGTFNITAGTTNTIGVGTFAISGTTTINGTLNFTSVTGAKSFANVILNSGSSWNSAVAETYTINNNLTMSGATATGVVAGIFNVMGNFITSSGTTNTFGVGTMTVSGITTNAGSINFSSTTGNKTFVGKITNTGTWTSTANEAFTIRGGITNNGTFSGGSGTYTFNSNSQVIDGANGITFGGVLALANNIVITNQNTNTVTVTSNLTGGNASSGWINAANTSLSVGGSMLTTGVLTATATPNTVNYKGSANQTINVTTYRDLLVTSTGGTVTFGAVTVNNNFTVSTGTVSIAGVTMSVVGATSISGTLNITNTTGTKTFGDLTVNSTGVWNASVAEAFTIKGNLSNSGTFTANTGVYSLTGAAKTISGTLSVPSFSVTGTYTNNATLTTLTALQGAGTFSQGAAGTLNIGATAANFSVTTFNASTSGNTVNYNLAGAQSVRAPADGAYHHLTIGGSGTKTLLAATTINGNLSISSTLDASVSNFAINLGGNWSNTGTFTPGSGTVTLNGAGAQSITKAGGETFNSLAVSGSGTKTLGSNITTNADLTINSTLDVSSSNFGITVKGNWTNNGTFTKQNGTVTLSGGAAQTMGGTTTSDFYNLTQNNASGVSLTHAQNLINVLTVSAGTFTTTGFNFTLKSTASGTASIAAIPGGANFTGNIIFERYTGSGPTDWRFLCSAVTGATIADWADDFATSGFTGSTDPSNSFVSIYSYNESTVGVMDSGYVAATNVTNSVSNGKGYWVYLGPNPVTYEATGSPNKFAQSAPVTFTSSTGAANDGWNLIANPYPSAIDWDNVSWTKTKIDNAVYVYNSSTGSTASYVAGLGVNGGSNYIASQQAFWVKANAAAPALTMVENIKVAQNPAYMKSSPSQNTSHYPMAFRDFPIALNVNTIPNTLKLTACGNGFDDETFIQFKQGATPNFDAGFDAWKMQNLNPVIPTISSVLNDTTDLSINSLPDLTSDVTIPIRMIVTSQGTYSIRRDSILMLPLSSCIMLEDLANGNMTDLRSVVSYSFTISDTTKAPRFLLHIYAPVSKNAVNTTCANDSSGMAIAKGTGAGPWNYVWKNAGGQVLQTTNNSSSADTLFNIPMGTYSVEVSGSACGIVTDTIEVKTSSTLQMLVNYSDVTCNGLNNGAAHATISGGKPPYIYAWNSGATTSAINNLAPGNYSVSVIDSSGCSQAQTIIISQPAILIAGFTSSTDTVDLSVSNSVSFVDTSLGATSYQWNFGDTSSVDTSHSPLHYYSYAGTYTTMLVVSNGTCLDTSYKNIVVIYSVDTTGVHDLNSSASSMNIIYSNGEVFLDFDLPQAQDVCISIYNTVGERLLVQNVKEVRKNRIKLDVSNFASGIYVSVADMGNAVLAKKLILPSR